MEWIVILGAIVVFGGLFYSIYDFTIHLGLK